MKKSTLLRRAKKYLAAMNCYDRDDLICTTDVCSAIMLAAVNSTYQELSGKTAGELIVWIKKSILPYNSIRQWLQHVDIDTDNSFELLEYRKAWVDNMIAFWKSKGD